MQLTAALQGIVAALQGAGLAADTDTDKLQPPCAWVAADRLRQDYLDGGADLDLSVYLIARATGYADELAQLQQLLGQALAVISPDGEIELDQGVQTNAGILPAFKIPLTVKVEA